MDHRPAAVVSQLRGGYRRALQITAQVFDTVPGSPSFLREVHLPVAAVLGLQIASPLNFIANVAQTRQPAGSDTVVVFAQQTNNRPTPDFLHLLLLKKQSAPDVIFDIEATSRHGNMDVGMLIELAAIGVQGAENADLDTLFTCPTEQGAGGATKQVVEQGPVIVEEGPKEVRHGEGDVLPVAVWDVAQQSTVRWLSFRTNCRPLICNSDRRNGNGCSQVRHSSSGAPPWHRCRRRACARRRVVSTG